MSKTPNEIFIEKNRKLNKKRDKRGALQQVMRDAAQYTAAKAAQEQTAGSAGNSGSKRKKLAGK